MEKYKYIFVVLVYKNTEVLDGFFESLSVVDDYKVVLVNSFYDDASEKQCQQYAEKYNADFLSVPNKGYGAGNNAGFRYIKEHYEFEYVVVSNSDIIIKQWDTTHLNDKVAIYAPDTTMLTGKKQNPNIAKYRWLHYYLIKRYSETGKGLYLYLSHIISRFDREIYLSKAKFGLLKKDLIFSCHGSFFIMTKSALDILMPVFNEKMFLYNEEGYLAYKSKYMNVSIFYVPDIKVLHLEGASTKKSQTDKTLKNYDFESLKIMVESHENKSFF